MKNNDDGAKKAYAKALKMRLDTELKNAGEKERPFAKAYLAQKLHEQGHFDLELCNAALDALCAELFNEAPPEPPPASCLADEPAHPPPRRAKNKAAYILLALVFALLAAFAAVVWYHIVRPAPKAPELKISLTETQRHEGRRFTDTGCQFPVLFFGVFSNTWKPSSNSEERTGDRKLTTANLSSPCLCVFVRDSFSIKGF